LSALFFPATIGFQNAIQGFNTEASMIAVIDNCSQVRRQCFDVLNAAGLEVAVFHSPETFVHSGAVHKSGLLILGRTTKCVTQSAALQWASSFYPDLKTYILSSDCAQLLQLATACNAPVPVKTDEGISCSIDLLHSVLYSEGPLKYEFREASGKK
jgi:hypothetical protein